MLKRHRWEIEQREPYAGECEGMIKMIEYENDRERMNIEKEQQKAESKSRRTRTK